MHTLQVNLNIVEREAVGVKGRSNFSLTPIQIYKVPTATWPTD